MISEKNDLLVNQNPLEQEVDQDLMLEELTGIIFGVDPISHN